MDNHYGNFRKQISSERQLNFSVPFSRRNEDNALHGALQSPHIYDEYEQVRGIPPKHVYGSGQSNLASWSRNTHQYSSSHYQSFASNHSQEYDISVDRQHSFNRGYADSSRGNNRYSTQEVGYHRLTPPEGYCHSSSMRYTRTTEHSASHNSQNQLKGFEQTYKNTMEGSSISCQQGNSSDCPSGWSSGVTVGRKPYPTENNRITQLQIESPSHSTYKYIPPSIFGVTEKPNAVSVNSDLPEKKTHIFDNSRISGPIKKPTRPVKSNVYLGLKERSNKNKNRIFIKVSSIYLCIYIKCQEFI